MFSFKFIIDYIFGIVFVIATVFWIFIMIYANKYGNIEDIVVVRDFYRQRCGYGNLKYRPYLLILVYKDIEVWESILEMLRTRTFIIKSISKCVEKCPDKLIVPTLENHYCIDGINVTSQEELVKLIYEKKCAPIIFDYFDLLRYCIPLIKEKSLFEINKALLNFTVEDEVFEKMNKYLLSISKYQFLDTILDDFRKTLPYLALYILFCLVITLNVLLIVSYCTYWILCLIYIATFSILIALSTICFIWYRYDNIHFINNIKPLTVVKIQVESIFKSNTRFIYMIIGIISLILGIFVLLVGLCLNRSVAQAFMCAKQSAKSLFRSILSFIIPIISVILQTAVLFLGIYILLLLFSIMNNLTGKGANDINIIQNESVKKLSVEEISYSIYPNKITESMIKFFIIHNIFMLIWNFFLIRGIFIYIISYSFYANYSQQNDFIKQFFLIFQALNNLFISNICSIIFGSFLIAFFSVLLLIFEIGIRLLKLDGEERLKLVSKYVRPILIFITTSIKQLTDKTYIQIAISKRSFCESAKQVAKLFSRDPILFFIIEVYSKFILVFGSVIVSITTAFLTYQHIKWVFPNIFTHLHISVIIGLISLIISWSMISVYSIGIYTFHFFINYESIDSNNFQNQKLQFEF